MAFGAVALVLLVLYPYGLRWELAAPIFVAGCMVARAMAVRLVARLARHPRFASFLADDPPDEKR